MGRFVAVVTVLLVVAGGCSDAGGDTGIDSGGGEAFATDVATVVGDAAALAIDDCIDSLGPEDAFRGVVFAFDNGYDADQVTVAMGDGSLDGNGVIAGVEPSGAMVGLIDRSGPSAYGSVIIAAGPVIVAGASPVTAEEFKRGILDEAASMFLGVDLAAERERQELTEEASRALIATTVALIGAGYTMDQVIEFVVFGERAITGQFALGAPECWVVLGADGLAVFPENEALTGDCAAIYEGIRDLEIRDGRRTTTTTTTTTAAPETTVPETTVPETTVPEVATTGTISGVVLDVAAAVGVAGATVTVTPGGASVTTDADGLFTVGDVEPGSYTVTAIAEGFPPAAAEVTVAAGEVSDTTIGLEKDDLPWVFEGTSTTVLTAGHPFGSGAPFVLTKLVYVMITLKADGTAVLYREFPESGESLTVDCTDRTAYLSTRSGSPPQTIIGTHAGGEFEIPMGDIVFTGTYTSSEIQGHLAHETTKDWCDDSTLTSWKSEFSFGPEGMERVHDAP